MASRTSESGPSSVVRATRSSRAFRAPRRAEAAFGEARLSRRAEAAQAIVDAQAAAIREFALLHDRDDRVGRRQRRQRHAAQTRLIGLDQGRAGGERKTDYEEGEAADHRRRVAQVEAEGKAPARRGYFPASPKRRDAGPDGARSARTWRGRNPPPWRTWTFEARGACGCRPQRRHGIARRKSLLSTRVGAAAGAALKQAGARSADRRFMRRPERVVQWEIANANTNCLGLACRARFCRQFSLR